MIKIPFQELSADALQALIEEFVSRDGTDLAEGAAKVTQVRAQLRSGAVIIVYDEASESANIVPKDYRPPQNAETSEGPRIVYDEETSREFGE